MISDSAYRQALANDLTPWARTRSHAEQDGVFEQDFEVTPAGLLGLNRLARKLNALEQSGTIRSWSHGRWKNLEQTRHGIRFESARDLNAARLSILLR